MLRELSARGGGHRGTSRMSDATAPGHAVPAEPTASRSRLTVITSLGIAQILAWGSSYYLLAVLAGPIAKDTGWPLTWIMGALSIGLLVSGLVSPGSATSLTKGAVARFSPRAQVLLAGGMLLLGVAPNMPVFVAAWVVIGLGMGAGLYDPAFSTLGRLYGEQARSAITQLTLFGGFASTVCWPLTAFLGAHLGWRGACLTYSAILIGVVLPLYLLGLPREARRTAQQSAGSSNPPGHVRREQRAAFVLLAAGFTLAYLVMTIVAVHLLTLLQSRGVALAAAVGLGTLIGPSQVGGRILEMTFGKKSHPVWSLLASSVLVAIGLAMLVALPGIAAACIVLYGMGSGIRSIARGTVPLAMFGREGYAILMGRIALPALLATAAAPIVGAWLLDWLGPTGTLVALFGAALVNLALVLPLIPMALKRPAPDA